MIFTTKAEYGVRLLIQLGLQEPGHPVSLKAVAEKLVSTLEGLGLSAFGAEGDPFDPALHEAVQHEGDGSNPVIGTVMRQGYKVGDQVVRHAMVGVVDTVENAAPSAEQPAESEN